ncbi:MULTISPECIES: ABC-three component system middle component 6 [unclassified Pseudoalteromonas]|uniref:ABC-three component system middle component 6 n=1 Tax=unclassified Pseudoalteromonas TaxID=194690 RepID=UPI003FA7139C
MIISQNIHPEFQLYYLGARTLEILNRNGGKSDFFEAYQELKKNEKVSIKLFIHTLDWLFLLGAIKSEKGWIEQCS